MKLHIGMAACAVIASCGGGDPDPVQPDPTDDVDSSETDTDTDTDADADTDTASTDTSDTGAPVSDLDATGGFVGPGTPYGTTPGLPSGTPFHALQLNLCNSGHAGCFAEGRSVPEARDVITEYRPNIVTLNEICEDNVSTELLGTMQAAWPNDWVFWVFTPAESRGSGGPVTCTDGQRYGVGILGHVAAERWTGFTFQGDRLGNQSTDDEMRAWACAYASDSHYVCTMHLENDDGDVAMRQCQEVMNPIVPQFWGANGGSLPTIVGGDLNLTYGGNPDVQDCVPPAWYRKGDGNVQHILATDDFTFVSTEEIPMTHTDHDAWLVRYVTP